MTTAAPLPKFTPALGNIYLTPEYLSRKKATESRIGRTSSKENTPLPESQQSKKAAATPSNNQLNSRLLEETLNITLKYGDEYMDEIPITGQPGEFHLSSTGRKTENLMVPVAAPKGPLAAPTPKPAPPALKTDIEPAARKGSKSEKSPRTPGMPKLKRRKSKVTGSGGGGGVSPS
jgi:mediator of RNA polymerase II transcription subunit 6